MKEGRTEPQQRVDHCERFSMAEAECPAPSSLSGHTLFDSTRSSRPSDGPGPACEEVSESSTTPQHPASPGALSPPNESGTCAPSHQHQVFDDTSVHRNPSDSLPVLTQGASLQAPRGDTGGRVYLGADKIIQGFEGRCASPCKQPMQLQQCNFITTVCRGASGGDVGFQQPKSRCVCISSPKVSVKGEGVEEKGHLLPQCDKPLCYDAYNHHAIFEDTFAAYCHPQPIPASSQLLQHLATAEPTKHLTLPRLVSSVSETGLDAKHLLRCCNLNCSWISSVPPGAGPQTPKHLSREECCSSAIVRTRTRDVGTVMAPRELRDVGVQTEQTVTPHVFPQICLTEESRGESSSSRTPSLTNTDSDGGKKTDSGLKSPVKEVKWDAEGMTWEVYGASVDPEELGLAIQKHLELQIRETASRAKLSRQNTNTSRQSGNTSGQRKTSRLIDSFRTCCTRSTTAVD
ncbi:uncharacterized protein si:dkey-191g9.7 [Solea solea]|uniref:uncharacterized protein si:dkey-191g9.7 n=1 Tax=Solea solea TaxID=90069 RepID=UPI00272B7CDF|nr:uncharacterized protein si:dkey-191g9.7 [Solea solea]